MSESIQEWLKTHVKLPGLIGSGVVVSGVEPMVHSCSVDLPDEMLKTLFQRLAEIAQPVIDQQPKAERLRWVFDDSFCYAMPRPDGALLVLLSMKEVHETEALEQLAAKFRAQQ